MEIRDQAHHAAAGLAVVLQDAYADLVLEGNAIFGEVCLYGTPGGDDIGSEEIGKMQSLLKEGTVTFKPESSFCRVCGNSISNMAIAETSLNLIRTILENNSGVISGVYRTMHLEGNVVARDGYQLLGKDITLTGNDFLSLQDPIGWIIGESIILTANRISRQAQLQAASMTHLNLAVTSVGGGSMLSAAREMTEAANLPNGSW